MSTVDLIFEGGSIFNRDHYPLDIMEQALPVMKQLGNNLDVTYAQINVEGAKRDLSSVGYSVIETTHTEAQTKISTAFFNRSISEILLKLFKENISIVNGPGILDILASYAEDGLVAHTNDHFFGSSTQSGAKYFSYQMAFYHLPTASFCFIVLTLVAFKDTTYVFGIPASSKSGVCFSVQVFQCKKVHNNVIYSSGRLQSGESMASPDGHHIAVLGNEGNFVVDGRWQTGTAGKGVGPWFLILQEDGNLVIYDSRGAATWASNSWQEAVYRQLPLRLNMQDDGNLVIYDAGDVAIWAIGNCKGFQ